MNPHEQFHDRLAELANTALRSGLEGGFNDLDRETYLASARAEVRSIAQRSGSPLTDIQRSTSELTELKGRLARISESQTRTLESWKGAGPNQWTQVDWPRATWVGLASTATGCTLVSAGIQMTTERWVLLALCGILLGFGPWGLTRSVRRMIADFAEFGELIRGCAQWAGVRWKLSTAERAHRQFENEDVAWRHLEEAGYGLLTARYALHRDRGRAAAARIQKNSKEEK